MAEPNPNIVRSVTGQEVRAAPPTTGSKDQKDPNKQPVIGQTYAVMFNDGRVIEFRYAPGTPPPVRPLDDASWILQPDQARNHVQGQSSQVDDAQRKDWERQVSEGKKPEQEFAPGAIHYDRYGNPGYISKDEQGNPVFTPVQGGPQNTAPNKYKVEQVNGVYMMVDQTTSAMTQILDSEGKPVRNQQEAEAHAQRMVNERTTNAVNLTTAANNTINTGLAVQKQQWDQYLAGLKTRVELGQLGQTEANAEAEHYYNMIFKLPRQYQDDQNQARNSTNAAANLAQSSDLTRESYAQAAGGNAVNDAQWALSHGISGAQMQSMQNMVTNPQYAAPDFSPASGIAMPNFPQLRAQGQQEYRNQMPSFAQTLAATTPYGTVAPPIAAMDAYHRANVSPYNQVYQEYQQFSPFPYGNPAYNMAPPGGPPSAAMAAAPGGSPPSGPGFAAGAAIGHAAASAFSPLPYYTALQGEPIPENWGMPPERSQVSPWYDGNQYAGQWGNYQDVFHGK